MSYEARTITLAGQSYSATPLRMGLRAELEKAIQAERQRHIQEHVLPTANILSEGMSAAARDAFWTAVADRVCAFDPVSDHEIAAFTGTTRGIAHILHAQLRTHQPHLDVAAILSLLEGQELIVESGADAPQG